MNVWTVEGGDKHGQMLTDSKSRWRACREVPCSCATFLYAKNVYKLRWPMHQKSRRVTLIGSQFKILKTGEAEMTKC